MKKLRVKSVREYGMGSFITTSNIRELIKTNNYSAAGLDNGVTDQTAMETSEADKEIIVRSVTDIADLIPEDEKALEIEGESEFSTAKEIGYFSASAGMVRLENVLDGRVYASIWVDNKGDRFIQYCQKYEDGSFSAKMSVAQSDLILAMANNFNPDNITIRALKPQLSKFLVTAMKDYLGKFSGTDALNFQELLVALYNVRNKLPVYKDGIEATPEEFYSRVVDAIKSRFNKSIYPWVYHKGYYALLDTDFCCLAQEMKMSENELLKKLKDLKFLYLTKSCKGYQAKVRLDNDCTDWAYCILNFGNLKGGADV